MLDTLRIQLQLQGERTYRYMYMYTCICKSTACMHIMYTPPPRVYMCKPYMYMHYYFP